MELARTCYGNLILFWKGPFSFCPEEAQSLPDGLPGVYVLSAFTTRYPALIPFYVGQSGCIRRRLGEHLGGSRSFARHLRGKLSTYFSVAAVQDGATRTAAEAALIRGLSPAGNDVIPSAPRLRFVNLPRLTLIDT